MHPKSSKYLLRRHLDTEKTYLTHQTSGGMTGCLGKVMEKKLAEMVNRYKSPILGNIWHSKSLKSSLVPYLAPLSLVGF